MSSENVEVCSFCEAPLARAEQPLETVAVSSAEPDWRLEVARRLEVYRERRRRLGVDDSQSALPFFEDGDTEPEGPGFVSRPAARTALKARATERVEISVAQPQLDFDAQHQRVHPHSALVPVASLTERRRAGLLDSLFLLIVYGGFLALFHSMGGSLSFDKVDFGVFAATFFLLYAVYFALFTVLGGETPGMQIRGLTAVGLDGSLPDTRQLAWRSFGYVISGATFLLGFLWSLWDEDHFTWQDRISHTYLTSVSPLAFECSGGALAQHGRSHAAR